MHDIDVRLDEAFFGELRVSDGPDRLDDTGEIETSNAAELDRTLPARKGAITTDVPATGKSGLERYRLIEEVGQGGMAVVYRAHDETLDREVAVKVLHPHLAGQQESRDRLEREAIAVAKLRHENILEIFDYSGRGSDKSFIVTEFIHGTTLRGFQQAHALPHPEMAELIVAEIARALEHAHKAGVIHRDIKPENVMIRRDGVVKLTDFGIAQIVDRERMTTTGQLLGSPAYMAPEHIEGGGIDFRTDVFAVGILLYQLAVGELPFRGKNPHEVLKRIAECSYTPPGVANPRIGRKLAQVITRALAKDKEARFADVGQMRRELVEDLADAGIDDPRAELPGLFTSTEAYATALGPRLVAGLTARGRALRDAGRRAAALELWRRALEIAPSSGELLALVAGAEKRRRVGLVVLASVGVVVVCGGSYLGARALNAPGAQTTVKPPAPITQATNNAHHTPISAVIEQQQQNVEHRPPHRIDHTHVAPMPLATPVEIPPQPVAVAPVSYDHRRFELVPTPKSVQVIVDGKSLGPYGPALQSIELDANAHTIVFEHAAAYPEKIDIAANEPPGRIARRLKWKPATLTVNAVPKEADILIDGNIAARAGQPTPIVMPAISDGRHSVHVKVYAAGYVTDEEDVELKANEARPLDVRLRAVGAP